MLKHTLTAVATVAAFSATAGLASTISAVSIIETSGSGSNETSASETDGRASVSGFGSTVATQNADGTSEVAASTPIFSGPNLTTSSASFTQSETNDSGASRDYTLDYSLTGQSAEFITRAFEVATARALTAVTPAAASSGDNPFQSTDPTVLPSVQNFTAASFEYNITVNDVLVFNARADALMNNFAPSNGLIFDAVSNFTPNSVSNGNGGFTFTVDAIADSIFLGPVANGETLNVVSTLVARAYTPGFLSDSDPITVNTFSSDPVNLSSLGKLSFVPTPVVNPPVSTVPLPAAAWMLIAALGGLGAVRSRKA